MNKIIQAIATRWFVCFALALVTYAAYASVVQNSFIGFDDPKFLMSNPHIQQGFSWKAVKWAFSSYLSGNWQPLTWFSHMLDCQLYGLNPAGHHVTGLAFHIANTVLLFLLLQKLTARLWPSAFVALMFGIHPMHVESVAWVFERKDVLSAFFFLLTLLAYARYVELSRKQSLKTWWVYGLALLLFALGLMSKPMLVTLPCVLCLLDYWPLQRFQFPLRSQSFAVLRRLAFEKAPFLVLTAVSCALTLATQSQSLSVAPADDFPLEARLGHVPVSYVWYVGKLFWPANLSVYYALHAAEMHAELFSEATIGALILLAIVTWVAMRLARREPCLLVGWLWFLIMLLPVIGVVQVGDQAYADRYTYLPYIGLLFMVAWGLPALLVGWRHARTFLWIGALLASVACFKLTVDQVHLWKNPLTLDEQAIAVDENNWVVWDNLGYAYVLQRNVDKALDCLRRATVLNTLSDQAWDHLSRVLYGKGELSEARDAFQMALRSTRDKLDLYNEFGDLCLALRYYDDAITNFQSALELAPDQPDVYKKLGRTFARHHENDQAIVQFQNALRLQPADADAELELAMAFADNRQVADAMTHYHRVLELAPDTVAALNNLSWMLATTSEASLRDGSEAVRLAEHACKLTQYKEAFLIGTLAAAYAEAGRFNDAVSTARKACDLALAQGQNGIAARNQELMALYQAGMPFHQ